MILGLHGVMKHPHDMDRFLGNAIENIVLIDFELPIAGPDIVTGNTNQGIIPYGLHTGFEFIKILVCLINTKIFIRCKARYFLGLVVLLPADEFYTSVRTSPILS